MRWTHNRRQALWYALLIVGAWLHDHRELVGMLALITLALAADAAVVWLALASAHVGTPA